MRTPLAFALAAALVIPPAAAQPRVETRQIGTATLQNVPPVPAEISEAVQRYQNYREANFQDWLPDGSMLITTRFGATRQVHRVTGPRADRTQLSFFSEPVQSVRTIPGGSRFLVTRDTGGDEWFQLYAMDTSGRPLALTEPGTRNQEPVFSRDGGLVAWSRAVKGSGDYAVMTADPAAPASRRIAYQGKGAVGPEDVSSDGRRVLLSRTVSNRETRLAVLDLASGEAGELEFTRTPARFLDARFTRDGRGVIAITDLGTDVLRLVRFDLAGGRAVPISGEARWDVERFDVSEDGDRIAYSYNEDGFSRLVLAEARTGRALPQPELPRGVITELGFSPDGRKLAVGVTGATSAGDVWVWDLRRRKAERWTFSELGGLDTARLAEPRLIRFRSFDGLSVPAFVYRPKGIAPGVRTPVIIDIHGGPESQTRPVWNAGAQYFADVLGATVILPNVRGSEGYGKAYLNLDNGAKREDSVRDIGALLDWIAGQPDLDPARIAVYGQSYGGYMSLAVMTHYGSRLVGGVERYGISNWISFLNNTEAYRRDNRRAEYGDERDPAMRAVLERISPLANVGKIKKPMLVMQGANDPRVPKSESDQVVERLRRNGVETWYVVFADEGHGFLKKQQRSAPRGRDPVPKAPVQPSTLGPTRTRLLRPANEAKKKPRPLGRGFGWVTGGRGGGGRPPVGGVLAQRPIS